MNPQEILHIIRESIESYDTIRQAKLSYPQHLKDKAKRSRRRKKSRAAAKTAAEIRKANQDIADFWAKRDRSKPKPETTTKKRRPLGGYGPKFKPISLPNFSKFVGGSRFIPGGGRSGGGGASGSW